MNTSKSHLRYWGKARPEHSGLSDHHPLPYHCLDVAAVGMVYLQRSDGLRRFLQASLALESPDDLLNFVAFVLAIHDLGKFSEAFQGQRPDLMAQLRSRPPDTGKPYTIRHDTLGWLLWHQYLQDVAIEQNWFGADTEDTMDGIDWWLRASVGHHGLPPDSTGNWRQHFLVTEDVPAVMVFIAELRALLPPDRISEASARLGSITFETVCRTLSWWMAGITILADWIGSNTEFFPYHSGDLSLQEYWPEALERAERALDATGVLPARCRKRSFHDLFPEIASPSPLQTWAIDAAIDTSPQIHILEDVTGAGKTEASVILAHRLIACGCADGFFIALPTMATANAMYSRIAQVYRELFEGHPSLVLAHGQRSLVEEFAASVLPTGTAEADPSQEDDTATVRCNAWLADHNKRALLAPAGVSTIDQILLCSLYSKHQSLRLLGLFRKVLIVDEVHACDAYMQRVLETVLTFHAMAGGSAILLSATLPQGMKQALLAAFARGRNAAPPDGVQLPCFPLVTTWREGQTSATLAPITSRPAVCRDLAVRYVSDEADVLTTIRTALTQGKCVCWMRNTVSDVLAAHDHFAGELDDEHLIVFHARFALQDRLTTEQRILKHFGKASTPELRAGRLVIASQVAEQSLDADWDLVISDLAPIDRLLQRAGRLQRHPRSADGARLDDPQAQDQRGQPCLWVYGPTWTEAPEANWFRQAFPKAAHVYPHHGQLWLTAKALQRGTIAVPVDARTLIEDVFGEETDLPPGLQTSANQADGAYFSDLAVAQQNTIKIEDGYARGGFDWWNEAKTPTRLGEPCTTVLLARWDGERLLPWADHPDPRHAWAYSSVKVAERLIAQRAPSNDPVLESAVQHIEATLPDHGKWSVILSLLHTNQGWMGTALSSENPLTSHKLLSWHYDSQRGLELVASVESIKQEAK